MTNSRRLATVRARLLGWLAAEQTAAGAEPSAEPEILSESILIRDDYYCGRRFHAQTHHAVWFIEEDELKIYRNDGGLACVISGEEIDAVAEPSLETDGAETGRPETDGAERHGLRPGSILKLPAPTDSEHRDSENRDSENRDSENRDSENRDSEHCDSEHCDSEHCDSAHRRAA